MRHFRNTKSSYYGVCLQAEILPRLSYAYYVRLSIGTIEDNNKNYVMFVYIA